MKDPAVAVVIPAHTETRSLRDLLRSLHRADHDGRLTIIVAVDGGNAATVDVAEVEGAITVALMVNGGSYAARNAGLQAVPEGVSAVLFTDADCVVTPGWVREHLRALESADLSGGHVHFTFRRTRPSPAEWVDACRHLKQQVYVERDGFAATCNLAVRASVLREHQFDPSLRTGGDAEFCRRTQARLVYTPAAVVEHPARDLRELRIKVARLAAGVPGQADRWRGRALPPTRLTRGIWRRAQEAGHDVGPVWGVSACLIDWALSQQIRRAVTRLPSPVEPCLTYVLSKYVQPTQTFVSGEIAEMRRQGVQVEIIAMEAGELPPQPHERVRVLEHEHPQPLTLVRQHSSAFLRRPCGYARFLVDVRRLGNEIGRRPEQVPWLLLPGVSAEIRGQALHAHFAWSGAAAALLLSHLSGQPWSVTLHANDIFNRQRNLTHKLATADRLVTVCEYNVRWMRQNLRLGREVHVVICGVEVPVSSGSRTSTKDVIAISRLVQKKGVDVLLRAAALMLPNRPDLSIEVIGDGVERGALTDLARDLGVADVVTFVGSLPHAEALAHLSDARVFCLPARIAANGDRDSMPVVIKEAMARGVPVVASDVAAISEMLDGGCGVMVPPDDPAALAAALCALLNDREAADGFAARARERVAERFTLGGETAKLRSLLLGSGSRS